MAAGFRRAIVGQASLEEVIIGYPSRSMAELPIHVGVKWVSSAAKALT